MAFIKNVKTGVVMECHNPDVIKICLKDANFEVTEKKQKEAKKATETVGE